MKFLVKSVFFSSKSVFFEIFFVFLRSMNRWILILYLLAASIAVAQAKYYVPDSLLNRQIKLPPILILFRQY